MGNSTSRQPVTFSNPETFSVHISESALLALQGISPRLPPSQDVDEIVSRRVKKELDLATQHRLHLEKRSADQVRRETEALLERQKIITVPKSDQRIVQLENELSSCLRENMARPLDCWKQVAAFRQLARDALHGKISLSKHE